MFGKASSKQSRGLDRLRPNSSGTAEWHRFRPVEERCDVEGTRGNRRVNRPARGPILEWVNRADLFRVKGVSGQYSDLLEQSGVHTVMELTQCNAKKLCVTLVETNYRSRQRAAPTVHRKSDASVTKEKMNSKLYVGNLSYSTTEDALRLLFLRAGTVASVSLIMDRETHRSKGFAFVEMSNQAEALKAIEMFNGHSLDDRELRVSLAQQREERGGFRDRGSGHPRRPPQRGGNKRY